MKTAKDPRHLERIKIMQGLFAWEFQGKVTNETKATKETKVKSVEGIIKNLKKIDGKIGEAAPSWPVEKINKIDLAILRLAVYELIIKPQVPVKVVVDEAVELAKEYGSDSSASFVNGALGMLIERNDIKTT